MKEVEKRFHFTWPNPRSVL